MSRCGEREAAAAATKRRVVTTRRAMLTFSIALLVRPPLYTLLAFLALRVDAFLGYAVLDTAEAGAGVVALLARLLAVGAGVLDLSALGASGLRRHHAGRKGVHVHGNAGVGDGMHGHGRLDGVVGSRW